jgi:hypothetical protein
MLHTGKVAGSIPDEVIGFLSNLPNPVTHAMTLGSTQPLAEMSTRNLPMGVKGGRPPSVQIFYK